MIMLDLEPATQVLARLVQGVAEDKLTAPTPCTETSLGALLDHVDGLAQAFTAAANKTVPEGGSQAPSADASHLDPHWRTQIPSRLGVLAQAWTNEQAWTGVTEVGGAESPGEMTGLFALDEVIVHSWDIAVASGQPFQVHPVLLDATFEFVRGLIAQQPEGTPGLFGPPVPVPEDAPALEQLLGLTGRDPQWTPPRNENRTSEL
jgi:uncharacterized protein (TIGR03086 family)